MVELLDKSNIEELSHLSCVIEDYMTDYDFNENKLSIKDPHFILWGGNANGRIMIVKPCPNYTELSWAKTQNKHDKYIMLGSEGYHLRQELISSGFKVPAGLSWEEEMNVSDALDLPRKRGRKSLSSHQNEDIFFVNMFPFLPLGHKLISQKAIKETLWIFDSIKEIVKPKIIITLGYEVFNSIAKRVDKETYWDFCSMYEPRLGSDNILYLACDLDGIVKVDDYNRYFYDLENNTVSHYSIKTSLKNLFTKKEYYIDLFNNKSKKENYGTEADSVKDRERRAKRNFFSEVKHGIKKYSMRNTK